jgi:hypothetical protein
MAFFARPDQITADRQGRIYVLQEDVKRIDVFDTTGSLLRSFGRAGGGPGEFILPAEIHLGDDGSVQVHDFGKAALVVFDSAGTILPQIPFTRTGEPYGWLRATADTVLIDSQEYSTGVPIRRLLLQRPADTVELARLVGSNPMDRVSEFRCPTGATVYMRGLSRLFDPSLTWAAYGNLVALTIQSTYEVQLFYRGRLKTIVRRSIPPEPATADHATRLYPEGFSMRVGPNNCVVPARVLADQRGVAGTLPLINRLAVAPDGSVWVERFRFPGEPDRVDGFSSDGPYLGTMNGLPMPRGFLPDGKFIGLVDDPESGGQVIGLFRMHPARW